MAKDVLAKFALDKARSIVAPDGELELKDVRDNIAYVKYRVRKGGADCAQCAVTPDDLKFFLEDMFRSTAPHIKGFDIETEDVVS
jgi:folate-dependent tRNA-U54 methylase TrmFO/GidA